MAENIITIEHPEYTSMLDKWEMYRLTGTGGEDFLNEYLIQRPREKTTDFDRRKAITYIPSFSKSALNQIRNSIRQRLTAVKRLQGSLQYQRAIRGLDLGVDRKRSSMNKFIGGQVLEELTMMGSVGIYVDAPITESITRDDDFAHIPYLYVFKAEDIKSWTKDPNNPNEFKSLLLREFVEDVNEEWNLTTGEIERYRLYVKDDNSIVTVRFFDENGKEISELAQTLSIPIIPFIYLQLSDSLLTDVARHQITLLNLGSSDSSYVYESNITFYAEKYDPNSPERYYSHTSADPNASGEGSAELSRDQAVDQRLIGIQKGIRVPKDIDYPTYISPDTAPLEASMKKQEQLKEQINEIINQTLKTISSRSSSAESKKVDERREEDGLKAIGDELEYGENIISAIWAMYEGTEDVSRIYYPTNYQFKDDKTKRVEAKELVELSFELPSALARKAVAKKIATILLEGWITEEELLDIYDEIEASPSVVSNPEILWNLVSEDVISPATAAEALGYSAEEAAKAEEARVRRAERIYQVQSEGRLKTNSDENLGARGVPDGSVAPKKEAQAEKK